MSCVVPDNVTAPVALSVTACSNALATMLAPFTFPAVLMLPPMMLPDTLSNPVTYSPEVANTATFDVPPMFTVALPLAVAIWILDVPLDKELGTNPVSAAPLPTK